MNFRLILSSPAYPKQCIFLKLSTAYSAAQTITFLKVSTIHSDSHPTLPLCNIEAVHCVFEAFP